ncbi:MAG: hypothetical protein U0841_33115 [Chloroflexia bacterium]
MARRASDALCVGYVPAERLMYDHYHVASRRFVVVPAYNPNPGRAMLDDATLARLSRVTGEARYGGLFLAMADRLLEEGRGRAGPGCASRRGSRKWGGCMGGSRGGGVGRCWRRTIWRSVGTGDAARYFDGAVRAAGWYLEGQNLDGGAYYTPNTEGGTIVTDSARH